MHGRINDDTPVGNREKFISNPNPEIGWVFFRRKHELLYNILVQYDIVLVNFLLIPAINTIGGGVFPPPQFLTAPTDKYNILKSIWF